MDGVSVAASVLAIATAGIQISIKLVSFSNQVATAPSRIRTIGTDVSITSNILQQLSDLMGKSEGQEAIGFFNDDGLQNTQASAGACQAIFVELESALKRSSKALSERSGNKVLGAPVTLSKLEALKWPFLQPEIKGLHTELKDARNTLMQILQVTTFAYTKKLAELHQRPVLTASENSLFMSAIVALRQAKPKSLSSPLGNTACEDADKDQPKDEGIGPVPFSKDTVDDRPETSPQSVSKADNGQEQVLVKASSHVSALAKKTNPTSKASIPKTPVDGPPNSIRNKALSQKDSGRLSARIDSWRRKSAIVVGKRHSDGSARNPTKREDLRDDAQNTTGATVGNMKKATEHRIESCVERQGPSGATAAGEHEQSEKRASTWIPDIATTLMEIWVIHPTLDEHAPRDSYCHTGRQLPLAQEEIQRSFRRSRRWKKVDSVKQYAKLWPEERNAIENLIFNGDRKSAERRITGIIVRKMSLLREPITNMPQRQLLIFIRRYILDVPGIEADAELQSSLPDRPVPRIRTQWDDFPLERKSSVEADRCHPPKDKRHDRALSHKGALPIRGRTNRHELQRPSSADPELERSLRRLAILERTREADAVMRIEESSAIAEARANAYRKARIEALKGEAPARTSHDVEEQLDDKEHETDHDTEDYTYQLSSGQEVPFVRAAWNEDVIFGPSPGQQVPFVGGSPRDPENPEEETPEQIVDALLAKYTTVRL